jgi:REP element-mobilizing transposase RayT
MLFFEETDPAEIEELQLPGDDVKNPDELSVDTVKETGSDDFPGSPQPEETTLSEEHPTIEAIEAPGESADILVTPPPLDLQAITPDESISVPFSEDVSITPENDDLVAEESSVEAPITENDTGPVVPGTEPMGLAGIRLDYTAVLIPRHDQQYLARGLADRLSAILPQLHQDLGWRVIGISVRPHYLSWNFSIPATVTPLDAIEQIRHLTSTYLFTSFPELKNVDTDQDFWAPGYLVMSGERSISPGIIKEFIDRTRNPK